MLPRLIEYMLSLRNPGGGPLVEQGMSDSTAVIPPNRQVAYQDIPVNDYAVLVFKVQFDEAIIPGAFYATGQYAGTKVYDTILYDAILKNGINCFTIVSGNAPALATITNLTAVNQFFHATVYDVMMRTEEIYKQVFDELSTLAKGPNGTMSDQAGGILPIMRRGG